MANENDSGPPPENGEEDGNRPRPHLPTTPGRSSTPNAKKGVRTPTVPTLSDIAADLRTVHQQLTLVMSLVVVSAAALERVYPAPQARSSTAVLIACDWGRSAT